ncbi:hypothetical protein [Thermogemmatispora sp.]|uniref:hypothetical protein n=1 Tax=Thermogemmatispora sp. TaxID=1968838 RepID=UPI001D59A11C|nr:hypothetical protein [Thermogemmatispora sp.]MBX5451157.1 hypothetical protein [Thermogemmatispora sp.]
MKSLLAWWFRLTLPRHLPETTPVERERARYARLTSTFGLVIAPLGLLAFIYGALTSLNPIAPWIEGVACFCALASPLLNRWGFTTVAASLLVLNSVINSVGNLVTNPLDPVYVGIFSALVIPVVLAGALLPPVAALVTSFLNSAVIIGLTLFQQHTPEYDRWLRLGYGSIMIALPIALQLIVGIITYVIMRYLIATIRRADRAEEIIALQKEIAEYQRQRAQEQRQLEEGIAQIAQVHAAVANGNLDARVPTGQEGVLWQIAVPLNNLLNHAQQWKRNSDLLEHTYALAHQLVRYLQRCRLQQVPAVFTQPTGTPLDPILPEIQYLSEKATKTNRTSPLP